jgi:type VI secretion system ImpM family protein
MMIVPAQFGKIPQLGDFLSSGMDANFEAQWLAWQRMGFAADTKAGPVSVSAYLAGPVWAFAARPAAFGGVSCFGVTAPCRDAFGRCFPMSLFGRLPGEADAFVLIGSNRAWFVAAYDFLCAVMAAPMIIPAPSALGLLNSVAQEDLASVFALEPDDPGVAMMRLILADGAPEVCSIWWSAADAGPPEAMAICSGPSDVGLWQRLYRTPDQSLDQLPQAGGGHVAL